MIKVMLGNDFHRIELSGTFSFAPPSLIELAALVSRSEIANKEQLLQMLWLQEHDLEYEVCSFSDPNVMEKETRNLMRAANRQVRSWFGPNEPGSEVLESSGKSSFLMFKHNRMFYQEDGFREAQLLVERSGYQNPSLLCFMAFVLKLSDQLGELGLNFSAAARCRQEGVRRAPEVYPYYVNGKLWFEWTSGDYCSDLELWQMSHHSLLFGVKP